MNRPPTKTAVVALWLHDLGCPCGHRPTMPRDPAAATEHANRTQRDGARALIDLAAGPDPATAIIARVHDTTIACPASLDKQTFPDSCGVDRTRHLAWLTAHPRIHTLLRVLDVPTPAAQPAPAGP